MILALTAAALLLQPQGQGELELPQALHNAFEVWTDCLDDRLQNAEPRRNAMRMADAALRACRQQQRSFTTAFDRWLPTSGLNQAQMREARQLFQGQVAGMRVQTIENAQNYVEER
jgi:hypothetical protein